jgi:hypothetical protein
MKKEKDYTILMLIALFVYAWLCSCKGSYQITGPIQEIRGDTLVGKYHSFVVKDAHKWKVGDHVSFTGTKDLKIVNSKKIK